MEKKPVNIYTDGACSGNQHDENIGGWGAVLEYGQSVKEIFGGERNTTNNRMEMMALISALDSLNRQGLYIRVFSDSAYLMDCFRKKWYERWLVNGWLTSGKKSVENRDLWEKLIPWLGRHEIEFYRVKGHVDPARATGGGLDALYSKFIGWNGRGFSREDFVHITEMNNRADALAGEGIRKVNRN